MSITPSFAVDNVKCSSNPLSKKSVIIVDDEGDGDYTSIKDALNNADPGDIIEVYSGTYYEYGIDIEIEEITLKGISYELGSGNDTGKPLIHGQGQGKVMTIWAQGFTITGFRIENGGGTIGCGIIGTRKGADNCVISNNDIAHAITGCVGIISDNNKIINNNISYSALRQGIALGEQCTNNLISGNNISYVEDGIKLWSSDHNTVIGNRVSKCSRFAIDVASNGNYIEGNSIENNSDGVHIYGGSNNHVEGNAIKDNYVGVHMVGGVNNHIKNNNFINNEKHVFFNFIFPFIISIITNGFNGNYWDDWIGFGPKLIWGALLFIPWVKMDWHPAKEPYDIGF